MVLLVNHRCEELAMCEYDASRALAEGVVPADKVTLDEEVFAQGGGLVDADVVDFIAKIKRHQDVF